MKTLSYTLRFNTPAFLGNAEQSAQWRTPPIKAQLRQWWRVAYAADKQFRVDVAAMRHEEGMLFGHAWLENDKDKDGEKVSARKSLLRLRLSDWSTGTQQGVAPLSNGLDTSYAWFGLIKRGDGLPDRKALKTSQTEGVRQLQLALPDAQEAKLKEVISLMHAFGLLGSRSRGGWGSLQVEGVPALPAQDLLRYARPLADCLATDWAMSLATDQKGLLLWQSTSSFDSWDKALKFIALRRKQVRTSLKGMPDLRPALGFASPGRMPSPLRWKIIQSDSGKLRIHAFAIPHCIPEEAGIRLSKQDLSKAWNIVVSTLDAATDLQRLK